MVSDVKASSARSKTATSKAVKTASKASSKTSTSATATKVAKKATAEKTSPVKAPAKKPVATPKATPKSATKAPAKSSKAKVAKPIGITAEARLRHIEVAAYYIAEKRGFSGGSTADDWLAAEQQIDHLLLAGKLSA
ncbi:MAG: DUF2934 domain-containing protein [Rhodocyclaceae bacterium]|nr:DUF2934 domain-containing protein [Rhodocyclaceae bacterium]